MLTLGVVADTHVPDRSKTLHPEIIPTFKQAEVAAVLHAGDIISLKMLDLLAEAAPVYAVRGNRDWFTFNKLPKKWEMQFEDVIVGMAHGDGGIVDYVLTRFKILVGRSPRFSHFEDIARRDLFHADVVVFGHTHAPNNQVNNDGQLIFNPGSTCCANPYYPKLPPSVGLLHIDGKKVRGEIVDLSRW